ncbi:MAG: hypothetical protein NWP80_00020, partial [Candidatus Gracilibacteria bacterium]|nr:hypothetical protein [Candidatus Gracilibacteria bacterium]
MKIFNKILDKFSNNKNIFKTIFLLFTLFLPVTIFAQDTSSGEDITKGTIEIFNLIFMLISGFIGIISLFMGFLLSPEWANGNFMGLEPVLKQIWIFISNIVYFIFAILIVFIAVMNILGKQDYQLKTVLPRFIVGILIVPFSWFIVQFTIALSSILAIGVLAIPYDTLTSLGDKKFLDKEIVFCKNTIIDITSTQQNLNQ